MPAPLIRAARLLVAQTLALTNEFVMVSLWKDTAALKNFTGGDWTRAVVAGDELALVEDTDVDNYEAISEYSLAKNG